MKNPKFLVLFPKRSTPAAFLDWVFDNIVLSSRALLLFCTRF